MEKRKEQLKMLFFNPGKRIPGIPFIGEKINIFDPDKSKYYDFIIDFGEYEGQSCYVFSIKVKSDLSAGEKNNIVIDSMVTWFNTKTMEVMARNYDMSYDAGVYDFDVHMEVQMTKFGDYLVPKLLRYIGNWDVVFKKGKEECLQPPYSTLPTEPAYFLHLSITCSISDGKGASKNISLPLVG